MGRYMMNELKVIQAGKDVEIKSNAAWKAEALELRDEVKYLHDILNRIANQVLDAGGGR